MAKSPLKASSSSYFSFFLFLLLLRCPVLPSSCFPFLLFLLLLYPHPSSLSRSTLLLLLPSPLPPPSSPFRGAQVIGASTLGSTLKAHENINHRLISPRQTQGAKRPLRRVRCPLHVGRGVQQSLKQALGEPNAGRRWREGSRTR